MLSVVLIPRAILIAIASAFLSLTGCQARTEPAAAASLASASSADAESIKHGEYLVRLGGCNDCHTPGYAESGGQTPQAEWLTGSLLGHHGPWGTAYPSNLRLTIDKLSEEDWLIYSGALRTRPLMPDFMVRSLSESDRRDIYRFIKSLGPAGQPAPQGLPPGIKPAPPYLQMVLPQAATTPAATP